MKKYVCTMILCFLAIGLKAQKNISVTSIDGEITLTVSVASTGINYNVACAGSTLWSGENLRLVLRDETLGENPKLKSKKTTTVKEEKTPVVPLKFSTVSNEYKQLTLNFREDYSLVFRVFNNAVAYRFVTAKGGEMDVMDEPVTLTFQEGCNLHIQPTGGFKTSYENTYKHLKINEWGNKDDMATLPILVDMDDTYTVMMSETQVLDYPCMFLKGTESEKLQSIYPKVPTSFGDDGDRSVKILEEADYIAHTSGARGFPWRYFVIAKENGDIVTNTLSYQLSDDCQIDDTSWIKPGQVSWEWWNGATPYGEDVNFVSGYNLDTYKYFIDFASKYSIEYILMDEGWANDTRDPFTPNPTVNLHELIKYGQEKNVGIFVWLTWLTVENNPSLFKTFAEWGVKGVKIDFMDRSDQWMINFYERTAKEAAKYNLLVDYHGSYTPRGLEYIYPNILAYEGVRGMEQMGGCTPDNSLYFPFMRNAVGAMDYTPGAMISMQPDVYYSIRPNSASIGTRAYQMALYVICETGLQMLADNPTLYLRNDECTKYITGVPVTWDETRVLKARTGKYIIMAKRKGDKWFIGGIANGEEKERCFSCVLDFLEKGKTYKITSFEDGINAGHQAMDYRQKTDYVNASGTLQIKMVRNGGFAAVLE